MKVWFDYQIGVDGALLPGAAYDVDLDGVEVCEADDWAAFRLIPAPPPDRYPPLRLSTGAHLALRAESANRLEHRRRATGVDDRARVVVELLAQQFGDEPLAAGRAVVGCHVRVVEEQRRGRLAAVRRA